MSTAAAPAPRFIEYAVCTALAGWLVGTLLGQHPNNSFRRVNRVDPTGILLPNWRFFAPNPSTTDYHLLHRVLEADGTHSEWSETLELSAARGWQHVLWYPDRRRGKAVFDICSVLVRHINDADVTRSSSYHKLRDFVSSAAAARHEGPPPLGFQFMLVTHTGFDEEPDPVRIFASALEPWRVHELAAL